MERLANQRPLEAALGTEWQGQWVTVTRAATVALPSGRVLRVRLSCSISTKVWPRLLDRNLGEKNYADPSIVGIGGLELL